MDSPPVAVATWLKEGCMQRTSHSPGSPRLTHTLATSWLKEAVDSLPTEEPTRTNLAERERETARWGLRRPPSCALPLMKEA